MSILLAGSRAQWKKCKAEAKGKRQRDAESDPWKGGEGEIKKVAFKHKTCETITQHLTSCFGLWIKLELWQHHSLVFKPIYKVICN